jgi:RNA polymerase sigma-70 factor, ECF subfamily
MPGLDWRELLERLEADLERQKASPAYQRDQDAWESLEHAMRALSQYLRGPRWQMSPDEIEDALQQVLLKLQSLETLRRLRSAGNAEGYVAMMLKNAAVDILRQRERERKLFVPMEAELAEQNVAQAPTLSPEQKARLREELRLLSPDDRALLRMRFWKNMSIAEIARATGLTYSAAAVRLFRILHRMRAHLQQ